jgi:hypothetical protein
MTNIEKHFKTISEMIQRLEGLYQAALMQSAIYKLSLQAADRGMSRKRRHIERLRRDLEETRNDVEWLLGQNEALEMAYRDRVETRRKKRIERAANTRAFKKMAKTTVEEAQGV